MALDSIPNNDSKQYSGVLREVVDSARDLLRSDFILLKTEVSQSLDNVVKHGAEMALFGGILAVSVLPFLAFLVIGLGNLMDGRYWLSSLIVAVVCALVGGIFAKRSYNKMKMGPMDLSHTQHSLKSEADSVQHQFDKIKRATKGVDYGKQLHT